MEIKFDPLNKDEMDTIKNMLNAEDMQFALSEIHNNVFRPARKHGYSDRKIQDLLDKTEDGEEIIGLLEEEFFRILNEYNITIG